MFSTTEVVVGLVELGFAGWVYADAKQLGARRGRLDGGLFDMGPWAWFFSCFLCFIVGFVCYLVTRPRLVAADRADVAAWRPPPPQGWVPQGPWYPPPPVAPPFPGQPWAPPGQPWAPPGQGWGPPSDAAEGVETARLRRMFEAGEISQWEFDALRRGPRH